MNKQCIVGNWRISYAIPPWYMPTSKKFDMSGTHPQLIEIDNPPYRTWYAEIRIGDIYTFPDCGYKCQHCGQCLGCLRKTVFSLSEDEHLIINAFVIVCPSSPTGFHTPVPDDDAD